MVHLFGEFTGDSDISKNQLAVINANWDWTGNRPDRATGASMGQAAPLAIDRASAGRQAALTLEGFPDFHYPLTVDDVGFPVNDLCELQEGPR